MAFETMLDSEIGEEERRKKEKREIIIRRVLWTADGSDQQMVGRCHLHCASSSLTPPSTFVSRT